MTTKQDRIAAAVAELKTILNERRHDPESAHSAADEVLCQLMVQLGCAAVVDAWREIPKWYA